MLGGAGALGLIVGSFLNVVILRLPAGQSIVHPRSRCPRCGRGIPWYENIPVLSFLALGAKCRGCRAPISWRYPLVEALTGGLFVLAAWLLVVRHGRWVLDPYRYLPLAAALPCLAGLVALTFIDIDHRILPDVLTKPGMVLGAISSALVPSLQPERGWAAGFLPLPESGAAVALSVAGMAVGYGSLWFVAWAGERAFGREAMGMGDAKLLALIGAFTGPVGAAMAAALGLVLGLAIGLLERLRTGDPEFPFGPALAAGGAVVLLDRPLLAEGLRTAADFSGDPRGSLATAALGALLLFAFRRRFPRPLLLALLLLVALLAGLSVLQIVQA